MYALIGAVMRILILLLIFILLVFSPFGTKLVGEVGADPQVVTVPDIVISSPLPQSIEKYVNSSVELEIYVRMHIDSPRLTSISYSLDEKPLVFLTNLTISSVYDFGIEEIDFVVYTARVDLENLSEGNHTVTANVGPFLYTSRDFTVNSFVPVVEVVSPINQTYSGGVPLVFVVGGEVESAHYYMYRFKGFFDDNYAEVFENWFTQNITLESLQTGSYVMYLYATTSKGEALPATAYFSVSADFNINYFNPNLVVMVIALVLVVVIVLIVAFFLKKHKH